MNLSGIRAITRRPRRPRTLLERARKYIGSVKGPLKPRNVAARAKVLVRGIIAKKHSRSGTPHVVDLDLEDFGQARPSRRR